MAVEEKLVYWGKGDVGKCINFVIGSSFSKEFRDIYLKNSVDVFLDNYLSCAKCFSLDKKNFALEKTIEYLFKESHKLKIENYREVNWESNSSDPWWRYNWGE